MTSDEVGIVANNLMQITNDIKNDTRLRNDSEVV